MNAENKSNFWLDLTAEEIIRRHPDCEIIVSSGHSPSGTYHIGTIREAATASAITWALRQRNRAAKHVDFVDDFDVLRKIPVDLPQSLQAELGKPLFLAQSPEDGVSYGDYFYRDLDAALEQSGFKPDETFFARNTYIKEHRYTEAITKALDKLDHARSIIEGVSHRKLPADWAPIQILSDNDRLNEWVYTGHDTSRQVVTYKDQDGNDGEISYAEGRVKLDWRLDWPARWWMWGVQVEPFGRDHATKGGSYDTGKEIVKHIFGGEAPIPVPYEFIMSTGQTKKMSKSAGGVITPAEAMQVMPVEVLRYFIVRSRPEKQLVFDVGQGLFNLIGEFASVQRGEKQMFKEAYDFATQGSTEQVVASVPFDHLVSVYQSAQGDFDEMIRGLERTGWHELDDKERDILRKEVDFVKTWLDKYAPDEVKFTVQEQLPNVDLTDGQRAFLKELAENLSHQTGEIDGQKMHELIYAAKDAAELQPKEAFQALYRIILGKDYGPKAGWFLASLNRDWLIKRLNLQA